MLRGESMAGRHSLCQTVDGGSCLRGKGVAAGIAAALQEML